MMRRIIPLLCLVTLSTAYSVNQTPAYNQTLNQQMTVNEQKATGVNQLNKQQRENLESWLQNHVLRTRPQKDQLEDKTVTNSTLSINIDGGAFIQLYDGSVWEIDPKDRQVSENWISPVTINVTIDPGTEWPFTLTNSSNNETVKARRSNLNYAASVPTIQQKPTKDAKKPEKLVPPDPQTYGHPSQRNPNT